jgi:hypothetical protein
MAFCDGRLPQQDLNVVFEGRNDTHPINIQWYVRAHPGSQPSARKPAHTCPHPEGSAAIAGRPDPPRGGEGGGKDRAAGPPVYVSLPPAASVCSA